MLWMLDHTATPDPVFDIRSHSRSSCRQAVALALAPPLTEGTRLLLVYVLYLDPSALALPRTPGSRSLVSAHAHSRVLPHQSSLTTSTPIDTAHALLSDPPSPILGRSLIRTPLVFNRCSPSLPLAHSLARSSTSGVTSHFVAFPSLCDRSQLRRRAPTHGQLGWILGGSPLDD